MTKKILKNIISNGVRKIYPNIEMPDFSVEYADEKFGDFSSNIAMILAKKGTQGSPEEIATKLIEIVGENKEFESVVFAKPGFINFKMSLPFWQEKISEIINASEKYGKSDLGNDLKVNIEFVSANPTGPLTLGNGRGGYFGDVLANVFENYGAKVEREYYINDCGAQVTVLGHSVLKDSETVYKGEYIDKISKDIKTTDPQKAGQDAAVIITEEYIKKTIKRMGIKFDYWYSQQQLFDSGKVYDVIQHLEKEGLCYKKDGALWLRTSRFLDDKDRVLVTKEGEHTYFASDIAYHIDKIQRGYDLLINIWGADHHGYVNRIKGAVEIVRAKENWNGKLEILITQLVRLISKGQEIKMSKRSGTYVTLDELLTDIGPDVARFFFLQRALNTHMDFDLDLAKEKSQKNPVFYVQYATARCASILRKFEIRNSKSETNSNDQNLKFIKQPEEIALIKQLTKLPELIEEIVGDYQVQKLPFYAISLADAFHKFYEKCPVLNAENDDLKQSRLQLIKATQIVLKKTLDLMGVSAPEKM